MLAARLDSFEDVKFPVLATPKIDGIRCLVIGDKALTRSLKPIPNLYIRHALEFFSAHLSGCDGELTVLNATFNEVSSAVRNYRGNPDFYYMVFDRVKDLNTPYVKRIKYLEDSALKFPYFVKPILPIAIFNSQELIEYEEKATKNGYEGVIIRSYNSIYKEGRSTLKEGYMLKIKRFKDSDARIIGFEELMHNENTPRINELGYTKRSSALAGEFPAGMLGALCVEDLHTKQVFKIGSGFTDRDRIEIWDNRPLLLNKIVKYKFQQYGTKDAPRLPVFLGIREDID